MSAGPSSGVVPITVPLGKIPTYVLQNQPGKTLQIINTSSDTVWVSSNAGMVANTPGTTSIPGFTTAQWSAPGGVYLIADPAATQPINVQVTYTATNWQPSPVAVGQQIAANGTFLAWPLTDDTPFASTTTLTNNAASLQIEPVGCTGVVIQIVAKTNAAFPASGSFGSLFITPFAGSYGDQFVFDVSSTFATVACEVWVPTYALGGFIAEVNFDPSATISSFSMRIYAYKGVSLGPYARLANSFVSFLTVPQMTIQIPPTVFTTTPINLIPGPSPRFQTPSISVYLTPLQTFSVARAPAVQPFNVLYNGNTFDVMPLTSAALTAPTQTMSTVGQWYAFQLGTLNFNIPGGYLFYAFSTSSGISTQQVQGYLTIT